jgi:predicted N-formylglutamate amidohydrolase
MDDPPASNPLLARDEPPPFEVVCPLGTSDFVLTADHAGCLLPRALADLGVPATELTRHIAWDIGVAALGRALSARLDAFLILQTYSRLAIDINRPPGTPESIAVRSERTDIPGNVGLSPEAREAREHALFWPYHGRLREELDARAAAGRAAVLVSLHSFTPRYLDVARRVQLGVLHHQETRLARALLARLQEHPELVIGDNEPYAMSDATDYTVPVHAEQRGLLCVELELRQDLIADPSGASAWAERLSVLLTRALRDLFPS